MQSDHNDSPDAHEVGSGAHQVGTPHDVGTKRPRPNKVRQKQTVTCVICRKGFPRITNEHLRTHGINVQRYVRMYAAPIAPPKISSLKPPRAMAEKRRGPTDVDSEFTASGLPTKVMRSLADALVSEPKFVYTLADEIGEALFNGSARDRLRLSLTSVLTSRLTAHAKAVEHFEDVAGELRQRWRVEQGGEDGAPTPTSDLLAMGHLALSEIKSSEDLLTKVVKLAIDESKARQDSGRDNPLDVSLRYTGKGEGIPVPKDLTAHERETIRNLYDLFRTAVTKQRAKPLEIDGRVLLSPVGVTAHEVGSMTNGAQTAKAAPRTLSRGAEPGDEF